MRRTSPSSEVQLSVLAVAQALRRIDDRVEDGLEAASFRDGAQRVAHGALLFELMLHRVDQAGVRDAIAAWSANVSTSSMTRR